MRIAPIVTIVFRIMAINLALESILFFLRATGGYESATYRGLSIFGGAIILMAAFWLWRISPSLARRVGRGADDTVELGKLNITDLYSFAFVLVGIYFAVDSFGPTLTWFYYMLAQSSKSASVSDSATSFYTLFKYIVKLALGLTLVFKARQFSVRLINWQKKAGYDDAYFDTPPAAAAPAGNASANTGEGASVESQPADGESPDAATGSWQTSQPVSPPSKTQFIIILVCVAVFLLFMWALTR